MNTYSYPKPVNDVQPKPIDRPNSPVREAEVPCAMGRIHFALEQLDAATQAMADKIAPVLRQEPAPVNKSEPGPIASASLALALNDFSDRILRAEARITELKNKIEL